MMTAAAIEGSALSFLLRCAFIGWLSCGVLAVTDQRKTAAAYQSLLSLATLLLTSRGWALSESQSWVWSLATVTAGIWTLGQLRNWLITSPLDLHREALPAQPVRRRRVDRSNASQPTQGAERDAGILVVSSPFLSAIWLIGAGLLVIAIWPYQTLAAESNSSLQAAVVAHLLASSGLLALSLVVALQLTILSSPDGLWGTPSVAWKTLAKWGLACATVELLVSLAVLLDVGPNVSELDDVVLLIQRMFAMALIVSSIIAWIIPHRLANFQSQRKLPHDWVSLTLASWLASLAMTVVCFLPTGWPILSIALEQA